MMFRVSDNLFIAIIDSETFCAPLLEQKKSGSTLTHWLPHATLYLISRTIEHTVGSDSVGGKLAIEIEEHL